MPVLTFKVTADEARRIRARARASKSPSVSDYLRRAALPPPSATRRVMVKNPLTGLMVDNTPGPVVSDEMVRHALADFP